MEVGGVYKYYLIILRLYLLETFQFLTASLGRGPKSYFFFNSAIPQSQCTTGKLLLPVPHWEIPVTFPLQLLSHSSFYSIPATIHFQLLSNSSYYSVPVTTHFQLLLFHSRYYPIPVTIQFQLPLISNYHLIPVTIQSQLLSIFSYYSISVTI